MTVVQLLARNGTLIAEGHPDPATGHVTWTGDPSRPPIGGHPHIHILEEEPDAPAT